MRLMQQPAIEAAFDSGAFRQALGSFASGVTVITAYQEGAPLGTTVSAFSALSMDPPLVLVCLDRKSNTLAAIRENGFFGVNILSAAQAEIAQCFASSSGKAKFDGIEYREPDEVSVDGGTAAPLLTGVCAAFDCVLEQVLDGGDHEILVGRVRFIETDREKEPLVYFRSKFARLSQGAA